MTKDGATVAREVELEDPMENMGTTMLREVATKMSETAGDGTTTVTLLARSIVDTGLKRERRRITSTWSAVFRTQ